ncbi:MAG: low molecular weight phosphotyrosine protein phosphatase [Ruminococcaceae bacterium]|nr:low molecular weight phosphotyrosine protein phosphatase [Oscillospiraceae bacterium]
MVKMLFVCHGNICRSPMAEFVMKDLVRRKGEENEFFIASAATSREELGNGVYPPVKRILAAMEIDCSGKRARQVTKADYAEFDYIVCMDRNNMRNIKYIIESDPENKIFMLLSLTETPRDVADPWYTGDFEATKRDVIIGCERLYEHIKKQSH